MPTNAFSFCLRCVTPLPRLPHSLPRCACRLLVCICAAFAFTPDSCLLSFVVAYHSTCTRCLAMIRLLAYDVWLEHCALHTPFATDLPGVCTTPHGFHTRFFTPLNDTAPVYATRSRSFIRHHVLLPSMILFLPHRFLHVYGFRFLPPGARSRLLTRWFAPDMFVAVVCMDGCTVACCWTPLRALSRTFVSFMPR